MKKKNLRANIFDYIILSLVLIICVFPLIYTFLASFKSNAEILAQPDRLFPAVWSFENYKTAFTSSDFNVGKMLFNSAYYTIICVCFAILSSSLCAYVFERGKFFGKKVIFTMFSSLMFISLGSITVYPLFDILNIVHLNRSLWGLIVIKMLGIPIVNIYLVKSYIKTLPKELDEAAEIDGCSFTGIFFRIIAPLLKPIVATVAILAFQGSWNEYLMPTIFTIANPSQRTLMVGVVALKNSGNSAASWNLMLSGAVVALIPVLLAYSFFNRYFVSGLTAGAVKG